VTTDETVALLMLAACFDQRTVGQADIHGWHAVAQTEGWVFQLAKRAVIEHYGRRRERLMPADITNRIAEVRQRLHETFEIPRHPPELTDDPQEYVAWARQRKAEHMASGFAQWSESGRLPALLELEA
jgi:hypothetical protein